MKKIWIKCYKLLIDGKKIELNDTDIKLFLFGADLEDVKWMMDKCRSSYSKIALCGAIANNRTDVVKWINEKF